MVRYMVCLDASDDAPKIFQRCLEMTSRAGEGEDEPRVLLVGVAETYRRSKIINALRVDFDFQVLDKANKHIIKDMQEMLEDFKGELAKRGVRASVVVESGDPRERLCEVAERERPDLMMLGHRATRLHHLAQVGSVVLHCVEHAPCPVYIVRV